MTKAQDTDAQIEIVEWITELRESNEYKYPWHHNLANDMESFFKSYERLKRQVGELEAERALLRSQVKALTQNTEGESEEKQHHCPKHGRLDTDQVAWHTSFSHPEKGQYLCDLCGSPVREKSYD